MTAKNRHSRYFHRALTLVDFVILNVVFFVVTFMNPDVPEIHGRLVWLLLNIAYIPVARRVGKIHKVRALPMDRLVLVALQAGGSAIAVRVSSTYTVPHRSARRNSISELSTVWRILW